MRDQIRGNELGLAVVAKDERFSGTGQKIDSTIESNQLLGGGHVVVPGADDLVHSRNRFRAVRQGRNRLRPADAIELAHTQKRRGRQRRLRRPGRYHANVFHAGDLRRDHCHQQS